MKPYFNKCLHCDEFFAGDSDICKACVEFEEGVDWYGTTEC